MSQKVETLILQDRRIKIATISKDLNISEPSVFKIIHEHLWMSKVCSSWVPRMLTPFHKQSQVEISNENLRLFKEDEVNFFSRIITGDETWIHH